MEDNPGDVTAKVEEHYAQLSKEVVMIDLMDDCEDCCCLLFL